MPAAPPWPPVPVPPSLLGAQGLGMDRGPQAGTSKPYPSMGLCGGGAYLEFPTLNLRNALNAQNMAGGPPEKGRTWHVSLNGLW